MGKDTQKLTPQRVREFRLMVQAEWGDSFGKFAERLGISPTLLKYVESGERGITPRFIQGFEKVVRDFAYTCRDTEGLKRETVNWMLKALARERLDARQRAKIRRILTN